MHNSLETILNQVSEEDIDDPLFPDDDEDINKDEESDMSGATPGDR